MTFNFRKIYAKEPIFIKVKEIHTIDHTYFLNYADSLTKQSGRAKNNESGKARSYADYLIRLVIFYQEFFEEDIYNLLTFNTLKKLEKVVNSEHFKTYNINEGYFPSAAFHCYLSCVTHLNAIKEEVVDLQLNESLETTNIEESNNELISIIIKAQKRKEKVKNGDIFNYPRNRGEILEAKKRSNWQCELNCNHKTFISNSNKKPFIEAHHLIPMSAQDYFQYTLDFADNIVCLCPNCHRKIHHAIDEEKKEILKNLFKKREQKYYNYGIDISIKKIFSFYEIV